MRASLIAQLKPTRVCVDNSNGAGDPHRRSLGQPKFDKVKGVFHQPLVIKKFRIKRKQRETGERSRPEYSSGDRYRIRVVRASLITQLKPTRVCVDHLLQRSRQPTREKARTAKF